MIAVIVYEKEDSFIMITQHDHAKISGDLLSSFSSSMFKGNERLDELVYAAYEHDSSWIDLDRIPLWNDAANCPFSFRDFPGNIRFFFYSRGLDQVQQKSEYAALLGSILYTSLAEKFRNDDAIRFINREFGRQSDIIQRLNIDVKLLQQHVKALILCDELSLFVCMEEPGTPRNEYEWFANGFSFWFGDLDQPALLPEWSNDTMVELVPFPFRGEIETTVLYKEVSKSDIAAVGVAEAYKQETLQEHKLLFREKNVGQ